MTKWWCLLQRPTVLKINRKDAPDSTSTSVLWTASSSRSLDQAGVLGSIKGSVTFSKGTPVHASSHGTVSSSTSPEAISTLNTSQTSKGANTLENSKSSQSEGTSDEKTTKPVCVAVFAQGSGKVWGSASLTLQDAMDDCLQSGHLLVAIPSCQHQSAYSMQEAERVDAIAQTLLC